MFNKPREAKRLYFDVIPRHVDEYFSFLAAYDKQDDRLKLTNPVWHIHGGDPPRVDMPVSFALLLNLAGVANAETKSVLWGFLRRYAATVSPDTHPELDALVGYAIRYFHDFVKPNKRYRAADEVERQALSELERRLGTLPQGAGPEEIQALLYDIGRAIPRYQDLAAKAQPPTSRGCRWHGSMRSTRCCSARRRARASGRSAALYGIDNTRALIRRALAGEFLAV